LPAAARGPAVFFLAFLVLLVQSCGGLAVKTKPAAQKGFDSPESAVAALADALRSDNRAELVAVLGDERLAPGADSQEKEDSAAFLKAFDETRGILRPEPNMALLSVGKDAWVFPVPLRQSGAVWWFDTEAGLAETQNRELDRNELFTIETLKGYVGAQMEYAAAKQREKLPPQFARRFQNQEGTRNGLSGQTSGEQAKSLMGLAAAAKEECLAAGTSPAAFHGYFFKILTRQGEHARGGAYDYMAGNALILGFACVAYPEKYGETGVMTFIVNHSGIVYQKDLGEETEARVQAMTAYDPDESWSAAEPASGGAN